MILSNKFCLGLNVSMVAGATESNAFSNGLKSSRKIQIVAKKHKSVISILYFKLALHKDVNHLKCKPNVIHSNQCTNKSLLLIILEIQPNPTDVIELQTQTEIYRDKCDVREGINSNGILIHR